MRETLRALFQVTAMAAIAVMSFQMYWSAGEHQYAQFWDAGPYALHLYGRNADERYVRALDTAFVRARSLGFDIERPRVVQANDLFNFWGQRWRKSAYMAVDKRVGHTIVIDGLWVNPIPDTDVECIMAHELGHVIDYQTGRQGHPVFDHLRCLGDQAFADAVGRMLCGVERYNGMMRRYEPKRPQVTSECDVADTTTPVP